MDFVLREGETKVALCNFGDFLQGMCGDSKAHDYAKTLKLQRLPCADRRHFLLLYFMIEVIIFKPKLIFLTY